MAGEQTRSAIAEERQGDAGHRHHAHRHGQIDRALPNDQADITDDQCASAGIAAHRRGVQADPGEGQQQGEHQYRAKEADFFANDGENQVGVFFWQPA